MHRQRFEIFGKLLPLFLLLCGVSISPAQTSIPRFTAGGSPLRFVGGFLPGWHWGAEYWSDSVDEDLVGTARANGISVLHAMLPQFEPQLGVFQEGESAKLDHLLDCAARNGVYVMITFLNASAIALQTEDPYYNPGGIEGLINNDTLKSGFKRRIEYLLNRQNSVNGMRYRDDPTILAWIICDEPISAPWNYPQGAPDVSVSQLGAWIEEMASYIKGMDTAHLVTVNPTAAITQLTGGDWLDAFKAPSLDFIEPEDADMLILRYFSQDAPDDYPLRLFTLGKPIAAMLSFTSGAWDRPAICGDYAWQAGLLDSAAEAYFSAGATGATVFSWGSVLYPSVPPFDSCFNYNASIDTVCGALRAVAARAGTLTWPAPPLQFVRVQPSGTQGVAENGIPLTISLDQNFPNPFNPSTTFSFSIPRRCTVTLGVYDLLGREVAILVNGKLDAGRYTRAWNAAGMASGMYICRLRAGLSEATRKVLLLK